LKGSGFGIALAVGMNSQISKAKMVKPK